MLLCYFIQLHTPNEKLLIIPNLRLQILKFVCFHQLSSELLNNSQWKLNMWLGLRKPIISTHKISPDFDSSKYNKFLSVIRIVSKMSSYSHTEIHEEFNKSNRFCIAHIYTEQDIARCHNTYKCILCRWDLFSQAWSHIQPKLRPCYKCGITACSILYHLS